MDMNRDRLSRSIDDLTTVLSKFVAFLDEDRGQRVVSDKWAQAKAEWEQAVRNNDG
jgi:hypothetical protein